MKTPFLVLIVCLLGMTSSSLAQTWEKYYGTAQEEQGRGIILTSDGNYLAVGAAGALYNATDLYIVKTDTSGNVIWSKYIANSAGDVFESPDHFYYVKSLTTLLKMKQDGTILWNKKYTVVSEQSGSSIVFDSNGDILSLYNNKIQRYSSADGAYLSSKVLGKGAFSYLIKSTNGGYLLGGADNSNFSYSQARKAYFLQVDANLDSLWGKEIPILNSNINVSHIIENNGYYYAAGTGCYYNGSNCWYDNSVFFCLSTSGDSVSAIQTGAGYSTFQSIAVKDDGSILGFGSYGSSYPQNLVFFTLQLYKPNPAYNQLKYLTQNFRFHLGNGIKIVAIGNNRFIAVSSTKTVGHGLSDMAILKLDANLVTSTNAIKGSVFYDVAKNCGGTVIRSGEVLKAQSTLGTFYARTDAFGNYIFTVPDGDYAVTHLPSRYNYLNCPVSGYNVSVNSSTPIISAKNFYDTTYIAASAPFLKVGLSGWNNQRPCNRSSYTIAYANMGDQTANAVEVVLNLDPAIIPISATKPFVKNNNSCTFTIGSLAGRTSGTITIIDSIACLNNLLRQTKCANVKISYDTLYAIANSQWDKSSIVVKGYCDGNDSVRFIIKNKGQSMAGGSQYRLYESDGLRTTSSFQLNGNDSIVIAVYANGATYRLEADQRSGHPAYSMPSATIEACGKDIAAFPSGYVTSRASDDTRYTYDEFCSMLVGSFDPNQKSTVPIGVTTEHYINDNVRLKYHVDFQNTGTDLAYTIVVRDTLSEFLDPSTIVWGASSHPYEWEISGKGILTLTFNQINLPDSTSDEKNSHGYFSFDIAQNPGNALGTVIHNKAAIYFDYNEPVITNTVFHTINNGANPAIPPPPAKVITSVSSSSNTNLINVYPNPSKETVMFEVTNPDGGNFNLVIKDMTGREIFKRENITGNHYLLSKFNLSAGVFMYSVYSKTIELGKGKIILLD